MLARCAAVAAAFAPLPALAQEATDAPVIGTAMLPRDLSPWGMFLSADPVVKGVLIGLAFASVVTWTVWLAKTVEIALPQRRLGAAMAALADVRSTGQAIERLGERPGEAREFLAAAAAELQLSAGSHEREGIKERIASRLERIEAARGRRI